MTEKTRLFELAQEVYVSEYTMSILIGLADFMEEHQVFAIKHFNGVWVMECRVPDNGNYRSPKTADALGAFKLMKAGAALKNEIDGGRIALRELLHTNIASREDLEWALSRFDERGTFRR